MIKIGGQEMQKKIEKLRHLSPLSQLHAALCPINIVSHFWQARSYLLLEHSQKTYFVIRTLDPLLMRFFDTLEKQACKQKTVSQGVI